MHRFLFAKKRENFEELAVEVFWMKRNGTGSPKKKKKLHYCLFGKKEKKRNLIKKKDYNIKLKLIRCMNFIVFEFTKILQNLPLTWLSIWHLVRDFSVSIVHINYTQHGSSWTGDWRCWSARISPLNCCYSLIHPDPI